MTEHPPPLLPVAQPPLAYADADTDRQGDEFSADRELTWRLARANGWGAVGVGVLLMLGTCGALTGGVPSSERWVAVAVVAVPLVGMILPGAVLLRAARHVRGGGRGSVIAALGAAGWLACAWLVAGGLMFLSMRRGRDWVSSTAPLAAVACLLYPAARLAYHAVRVLALGGHAGTRDQTSGLDVAVPATDEDLWRLVARISVLHVAASSALLVVAAVLLVQTLIRNPVPTPPAEAPPQGTPLNVGRHDPTFGLPLADRKAILAEYDADHPMQVWQRQAFDDLLRHAGQDFQTITKDRAVAAANASPAGPRYRLAGEDEDVFGWEGADGTFFLRYSWVSAAVRGDVLRVKRLGGNERVLWSLGAMERWAAQVQRDTNLQPTQEQVDAIFQYLPAPAAPGTPQAALYVNRLELDPKFEGNSLRLKIPGVGTRYFDADGASYDTSWTERQGQAAAEARAAAQLGATSLPISPAWPAIMAAAGVVGVVLAFPPWRRARRAVRGGSQRLTEPVARPLLTPQAAAGVAAIATALVVACRAALALATPREVFFSALPALGVLGAVTWVLWIDVVLRRRVLDLARSR